MDKKKALLVTLADKRYVNQAKQLFSSAYHKGNWKGGLMLLSHYIPEKELTWFRNKGILIKKCKSLDNHKLAVRLDKFHLFTPEFKKWNNLVFLDADIMVRGSINKLGKVKGFNAVADGWDNTISGQATKPLDESPAFNSGVMAFSTDIIQKDTFSKLLKTFKKYKKISKGLDQLTFNLMFREWKRLPWYYNVNPYEMLARWGIEAEGVKGKIIHFVISDKILIDKNYRPWNKCSPFFIEWTENFENAEFIGNKKRSFIGSIKDMFKPKLKNVISEGYKINYKFTTSYFPLRDNRVIPFNTSLAPFIGKEICYLEIGLAEGASFFWVLDNILTHPKSTAIGIDNFWKKDWKKNFFRNLSLSNFKRAKIYDGRSQIELRKIPINSVDVIFIDGSHTVEDVLQDLVICWEILKPNGTMLVDDYYDFTAVKEATDMFLNAFRDKISIENVENKILKVMKWKK